MARWEPDARGRLEQAAMALFIDRGYEHTTVGDIAARAALTERTFFRYFADKREVLFSGSKDLERTLLASIAAAPRHLSPLDILAAAYSDAGSWLATARPMEYVRARLALISKHAELQERELIKLASLAVATGQALGKRGIPAHTAALAAELGLTVFKVGFERWAAAKKQRAFPTYIRTALSELGTIAAGVTLGA